MKKEIVVLTLVLFGFANIVKAQVPSDSVLFQKKIFGYKFFQNDVRLNLNQLPYLMEENQEAYQLIKKAKSNNTIASIISGTGGFLIGLQLANTLIGGEPNWTLMAVGGGLVVITIPLYTKSFRQSFLAVQKYNEGLGVKSYAPVFHLGICSGGVGFKVNF